MDFIKNISYRVKAILLVGLLLIIYGFIAKKVGIYFFWESSFIGWGLVYTGLIGVLLNLIKVRKSKGKKNLLPKIGIAFFALILIVSTGLFIGVNLSSFPKTAKTYFNHKSTIKRKTGAINSVLALPEGSIETSNGVGTAYLYFLIKGENGFVIVNAAFYKEGDGKKWKIVDWLITS